MPAQCAAGKANAGAIGAHTRRIFWGAFAPGTAGFASVRCFATATARQIPHIVSGENVFATAWSSGIVCEYPAIIRLQAKVCTKSHWLPVAMSQAASVRIREN